MSADDSSSILADLLSESELEREEERKSRAVLEDKLNALTGEIKTLQDLARSVPAKAFAVKLGKYTFHVDVTKRDSQERISAADVSISEKK